MSFVHLHTHSEFSLLDGANRLDALARRAAELEMPALALTDHGCMFGAWSFQQMATRAGIKPILGMEAYVAPGDRRERGAAARAGDHAYYHLVLLARDLTGYRNLVRLTSIGYREGFYVRPRIDREVLARYSEGLIVTSACMASEVSRHLAAGRWDDAREVASWYANLFDGRYYLEVQAHDTPGQRDLNERTFRLADELGLPVVATNDVHFLRAEDHDAHDVLLCIGLGKDRSDPNRMRYDAGLYFKSADEIADFFPDRPDVRENTLVIADQVDVRFTKTYHVPKFPLPEGESDEASYLRRLTFDRAVQKYGDPLPEAVSQRLEYELGVISNPRADYSGYFLITQDFINWAKSRDVPVGPGRGSAAGSLVAYVLGITDADPLEFDLLFERFLNPDRVSMPDIDVDFCFERRGEVIEYVRQKYGEDSVGQIITFGTMKSRAVIKDVGRTLGFEPAETDKLAKLVPNAPGSALTVAEAVEKVPELRDLYASDARVRKLLDYAMALEGLSRHASVHAAGVVIAPGPLEDYVPICTQPSRGAGGRTARSASGEGGERAAGDGTIVVTQWDMGALEQAGMLKMDFLGLKTLTVVYDAVRWIRERHGALKHPETGVVYERIEDVPLDDPAVYEMLAQGGTSGVFQFESSLATDKLRAMRCDRFEDLVATNALIRPGPLDSGMTDVFIRRKLGREPVRYPAPQLAELLEPTYGVITYQEQVMRIAQVLAGFTLAQADVLRKAVGKKDAELTASEVGRFVSLAVERGLDRKTAEEIGEQIKTFGRYGFNRSHSLAYALISYRTAWLKRYFPAEYMAALLSSVVDRTDDVVKYIAECRELGRYIPSLPRGIRVLPPDVNESGWKFTPVGKDEIRFGLGAIRGLGEAAAGSILAARQEGGEFGSLFELVERSDLRIVNRRALEALIQAGACDAFGHRAQLMAGLETVIAEAQVRLGERSSGQVSLFDLGDADSGPAATEPALPSVPPWPESDRLAREKETLGFFISGHPLEKYREDVRLYERVTTATLKDHRDERVELACVVTSVQRQFAKNSGAEYGRITVEDFNGTALVLALKEAWSEHCDLLQQDTPVLLRGQVAGRERDEDSPPLFLESAIPLAELRRSGEVGLELRLSPDTGDRIAAATELLHAHRGDGPLFVRWAGTNGSTNGTAPNGAGHRPNAKDDEVVFQSQSLNVMPSDSLLAELRALFGPECVRLVRTKEYGA